MSKQDQNKIIATDGHNADDDLDCSDWPSFDLNSFDPDELVSLYHLIRLRREDEPKTRRYEIGTLATAIEKKGVWTWDRYGRFQQFGPIDPKQEVPAEYNEALTLLAGAYEHECNLYLPGYDEEDPVFACIEEYQKYGWLRKSIPDLDAIQKRQNQQPTKPKSIKSQPRDSSNLKVVAILLAENYKNTLPEGKELERRGELIGVNLTDDTIRAVLKAANKLIHRR